MNKNSKQQEDDFRPLSQQYQDQAASLAGAAFRAEASLATAPQSEKLREEAARRRHLLQVAEMKAMMEAAKENVARVKGEQEQTAKAQAIVQVAVARPRGKGMR